MGPAKTEAIMDTQRTTEPMPAGATRLVLICTCGRPIPGGRHPVVHPYAARPCPDCGSRARGWERRPVGWVARLAAALRHYLWKRRRSRQP